MLTDEQLIGMAKARGMHDAGEAVVFGRAIEALAASEERAACAKECDDIDADMRRSAKSQFLTDAGRSAYTSASAGAASCASKIRERLNGSP